MTQSLLAAGRGPRWYQLTLTTLMPGLALIGAWIGGVTAGGDRCRS